MDLDLVNNPISRAIEFATRMHSDQYRKGTFIPYIVHPMEVMQILKENQADETTVVCGILHDTLEDTVATADVIEFMFGDEVLSIVNIESEHKELPYRERKAEHMNRVKVGPYKAKLVNCADKLSNIKSMYLDFLYIGDKLWERFNGTKEDIKWYYSLAIDCLVEVKDTKMYKDLQYYFEKLFG
ncbi:MAG: bifunctional (p)ppGpp synthetase/guanosine-3',5'-bis(diphosphate) 3'-pyrophosphohydrolase [Clostridia bacterium]|nr:bifunctional (p)ppGpp synthetase/guanosine-3',5'-bis(diphosphate) 3'-pyrophosphohydrolase [Clostridia bacterium]